MPAPRAKRNAWAKRPAWAAPQPPFRFNADAVNKRARLAAPQAADYAADYAADLAATAFANPAAAAFWSRRLSIMSRDATSTRLRPFSLAK
jgi:hypothetical protein